MRAAPRAPIKKPRGQPIIPAIIITTKREIAKAVDVNISLCQNQVKRNSSTANINPLTIASENSFNKRFPILPFKSSFAKPCTIIAEDCTPTFPAIAAISGVKKKRIACLVIISSKSVLLSGKSQHGWFC